MNLNERIARIKQLDKNLIPEAIEDAERYRSIAMMKTTSFENDGSQNLHTENKVEQRL
ncbi:MAG: hypothetical protein GX896_03155, partial [Clostridiales bacterium]|nr:hypothetical protein [Clostridiales bacterium]